MLRQAISCFAIATALAGCSTERDQPGDPDAPPMPMPDAALPCDPALDDDGDCITNGVEGCRAMPPADHDQDGIADHADTDSDQDGILDAIEVGATCADPRDADGDGTPDYLDLDSDNDGVFDEVEDRNGDGAIGTCALPCTLPAHCPANAWCSMPLDGTVPGTCVELACMDGETDPYSSDSDGDGIPDIQEGTFVCNPQSPTNPFGLKPLKYADALTTPYVTANWRLALELDAIETTPMIASPTLLDSGYTFDMTDSNAQVAGFLASRASGTPSAITEIGSLLLSLESQPLIANITVRVSGAATTSLDGFDTVLGALLEVQTTTLVDATGLREIVLAAALARPITDVTFPDPGWIGTPDTRFLVGVQSIRRANAVQTVFVGAVARLVSVDDPTRVTAFHLADASNGTGVAQSSNGELTECEQFGVERQAKADIIWIVDESGSMSDDRQRIADNAALFFDKAVAAGLDFRVAVTDMDNAKNGIFATRQSGGSGDRWLGPTEQAQFEANVLDPSGPDAADGGTEHGLTQGQAAILRHLPRDDSDPQMIREDAKLVLIYVSDEKAEEVEDAGILAEGNLEPNAAQQMQIDAIVAPYLATLLDNQVTAHLIAEPLPFSAVCSGGGGEHGYGYYELVNATSGQLGSICQVDLSATIDALIDDIIGGSSPIVLSKFPISASISVSKDGVPLSRSRVDGFDYRGPTNSIIFFGQDFDPGAPSEIVVSYRRWQDQIVID
jgi:hypothetical protein